MKYKVIKLNDIICLKLQITYFKRMWLYMLDINFAFKFNINETDIPTFISVIPAIIDLNTTEELNLLR